MPDSLPPKGIKFTDLKLESGEGLGPNSHGVKRATVRGSDLQGFFKPVSKDTHYPPELAKLSVINSQLYRVFMGDNAAEERLVVYETGEIAGTFSIAAPNSKPLLFSGESTSDPLLNTYINPSPETLVKLNITQLLVTSWFMKEDDLHGAQILFCHDGLDEDNHYINPRFVRIDFDMSLYPKTMKWKGARWVDGYWRDLAEKNMRFTTGAVTDFPNLSDGPYYWPSKPGVLGHKECKSMLSFQQLPNAKGVLQSGEPTSFKLQKFESILFQLLLFQPNAIRLRLQDYISVKTDKDLIDDVMNYLQILFDEFYVPNVFYRGDERTKDPAFKDFLRRRPTSFNKVQEFAEQVNELYERNDLSGAFDLAELEQKYHQLWRDAFHPQFNDIRLRAYKFYANLAKLVSVSPESTFEMPSLSISNSEEKKPITKASEMFSSLFMDKLSNVEISCDEESPLRSAFQICREEVPSLIRDIEKYFEIPTNELSMEHNATMVEKLANAEKQLMPLLKNVGQATSSDENLRSLLLLLNEMKTNVNFEEHIRSRKLSKDKPIDCVDNDGTQEVGFLPYNDTHVIQDVINTMFKWVDDNKKQFHQLVHEAVELYGSSKSRAEPIKTYLKLSSESGANQLACIFSRGGWEYGSTLTATSLNMHLLNLLLRKINHPSLQLTLDKLDDKYFYDPLYKTTIERHVVSSMELFHPYHDTMKPLFQESLFQWLTDQWELKQKIEADEDVESDKQNLLFEDKLNKAISLYQSNRATGASMWHDSSTKISKLLKEGYSYPYIFAEVILSSGTGEYSLATNLFKQIWPEVIKSNPKLSILKQSLHGQEFLEELPDKAKDVKRECESNPVHGALQIVKKATNTGYKGWFSFH